MPESVARWRRRDAGSWPHGCIRMRNADVIDLYERVKVGTKVVVM